MLTTLQYDYIAPMRILPSTWTLYQEMNHNSLVSIWAFDKVRLVFQSNRQIGRLLRNKKENSLRSQPHITW